MVMTPIEMENRGFAKTMRGYNTDEVDRFIQRIFKDYEALYRENQVLKDECEAMRQELQRYKDLEDTLNETLLLAQRAAEDTRSNAVKEAELIIRDARTQAEEMIAQAREKVTREQEQLEDLIKRQQLFSSEFKMLLMTHMELLEKKIPSDVEQEMVEEDTEEESDFM